MISTEEVESALVDVFEFVDCGVSGFGLSCREC